MDREHLRAPAQESGADDKNGPLSGEDMKRAGEKLRLKVESARLQKTGDIEKKLSEREMLIADLQRTDALIPEVQSTVEYFEGVDNAGDLDSAGKKQLEQFRATLSALEREVSAVSERINLISDRTEIRTALHVEAEEENRARIRQGIRESAWAEVKPEIDQLVKDVKMAADQQHRLREQLRQRDQVVNQNVRVVRDEIKKAKLCITKRYEFQDELDLQGQETTWEAYRQRLQRLRGSIGVFKAQEKAALDHLLDPSAKRMFEEADKAASDRNQTKAALESNGQRIEEITARYRGIVIKGWQVDDKIKELAAPLAAGRSRFVYELSNYAGRAVKSIANVEHQEQDANGNYINAGSFEDWDAAERSNPALGSLRSLWEQIEDRHRLIYKRPEVETRTASEQ